MNREDPEGYDPNRHAGGAESPRRRRGVGAPGSTLAALHRARTSRDRLQRRRAFKDDNYVVVEDIDDGRVVFEISSWPQVDRGGRLHFEGEPSELYDDLTVAQEVIDQARAADGVTGSDRPLRVGDVFLVKDLAPGADSITRAGTVRDVSLAARLAAKAALFGAAASTVPEEYVEALAIEREFEPPSRRGLFDVRQEPKGRRPDRLDEARGS